MTDIVELMLDDHRRIRQLREALGEQTRHPGRGGPLTGVWDRLAGLIELHLGAEQEICRLPMCGTGPRGREQIAAASAAAGDILEAIGETRLLPAGSPGWQRAVNDALSACVGYFGREEDGILADFARRADRRLRDQLGRQWLAFKAARWRDETPPEQGVAVCQVCGEPLPDSHPHVLDADRRAVWCACLACAAATERRARPDAPWHR